MNFKNQPGIYEIEFTAHELNTVGRGLAMLAGYKVRPRDEEEQEEAAALNLQILKAREGSIKNELKTVGDARRHAEEELVND